MGSESDFANKFQRYVSVFASNEISEMVAFIIFSTGLLVGARFLGVGLIYLVDEMFGVVRIQVFLC